MKDFFKNVFATLVGIALFFIITFIFGIISIVGMISASESVQPIQDNSVLVLKMSGVMTEKNEENILGELTGNSLNQLGLNDILSAIQKAKNNDDVKGIYLEAGLIEANYATLAEIRNELADFRKAGKWIVSYGEIYSQGAYYLASVADKVYLNPQGMLDWHGLASQPFYIKDLADKFGIKYQVVKVGTYKSATEYYTETKMSDANREQVSAFISGTWKNICNDVSRSRKISVPSLNEYADKYLLFEDAQNVLKYKMVDGLIYADQVKKEIKALLKLNDDSSINQISLKDMNNAEDDANKSDNAIAIYYAYGPIVQSQTTGMFSQATHSIIAENVCKDIEDLANDESIKAVVIRVNSPGGDAMASEQLWHHIGELKKKKPVVVSMGDYAASGGYYMSCNANWIVAQPNTLTGSIGIYGVIPDYSSLVTEKLGVKFDEVKTNKNSGFGNLFARPMNMDERALLTTYINRGYNLFCKRVADGRKMTPSQVETIAQGHVWLGEDAVKIKLVDQLGGLNIAVLKAAQLAKLPDYKTKEYPIMDGWKEQLLNFAQNNNHLDEQLRLALGSYYEPFMLIRNINERQAIQARLPMQLNIR